jgi:DNA-binding NtrC family response regulator
MPEPSTGTLTPIEETATLLAVRLREEDLLSLRAILSGFNWQLYEAGSVQEALACLEHNRVGVVVGERDLPDGTWRKLLETVRALPNPPYLVVASHHADHSLWAEVLNLGGYDVLMTPFQAGEVVRVLTLAWRHWQHDWQRTLERAQTILATV